MSDCCSASDKGGRDQRHGEQQSSHQGGWTAMTICRRAQPALDVAISVVRKVLIELLRQLRVLWRHPGLATGIRPRPGASPSGAPSWWSRPHPSHSGRAAALRSSRRSLAGRSPAGSCAPRPRDPCSPVSGSVRASRDHVQRGVVNEARVYGRYAPFASTRRSSGPRSSGQGQLSSGRARIRPFRWPACSGPQISLLH